MKKFLITTLVILSALMAQDMTGYEIMEKALNQSSWDDMQADMQLILKKCPRSETHTENSFLLQRKRERIKPYANALYSSG